MVKAIKLAFVIVIIFTLVKITTASITFTGDCSIICYLTTSYYNVTIQEGCIRDFYYNNIQPNLNLVNATATMQGIGQIRTTADMFNCVNVSATTMLTNSNGSNYTFISFYNTGNHFNNYTFYESFIQLDSQANIAFGNNHYLRNTSLIGDAYNGTTNASNSAITDWDSATGIASMSYPPSETNMTIAFKWNLSKTTDFDYRTSNRPLIAVGRTQLVAGNTTLRTFIKPLLKNLSNTGKNQTIDALNCFLASNLCGDNATSTYPCGWSGSGNMVITTPCNISSALNVCPYKLIVNSTGKLNLTSNALINASMFMFYPATSGVRVSITSGRLGRC